MAQRNLLLSQISSREILRSLKLRYRYLASVLLNAYFLPLLKRVDALILSRYDSGTQSYEEKEFFS